MKHSRFTGLAARHSHASCFILSCALLGQIPLVFADEPRIDPAGDLLQQQQRQGIERRLENPTVLPESPITQAQASDGACVDVLTLRLEGAEHLPAERRAAIAAAYRDRCLSRGAINSLLQEINAAYQALGYITTRAYLPEQHVENGVLRVRVIEGVIDRISLNDNSRISDRRRLGAAFPTRAGRLFRLQDIEQGMDQLNRAPSAAAAAVMSPGEAPGRTALAIRTQDDQTWRAGVSLDNGGERATGRTRVQATLDKDNLLEINDVWSLALSRADSSRALSLSTVLPYGYWTGAVGYSTADYGADLGGGVRLSGSSHSSVLGLERLFARDRENQWSWLTQIANRVSQRAINGVDLLPDTATAARLGGRWLRRDALNAGYVELDWVRGLDWWSATQDHNLSDAAPHHQFNKWELSAQWRRRLPSEWEWSSQFRWQYARQGLVGAEQLILGGSDSLRGFDPAVAFGDSGVSWRNQWSHVCPFSWGDAWHCLMFSDVGQVRNLQAPSAQILWSGGGGLRYGGQRLGVDTTLGMPLVADDRLKKLGPRFSVKVTYQY